MRSQPFARLGILGCSLLMLCGAPPKAGAQGFTIFTIAYATAASAGTSFPIMWSGGNPTMTVNIFLMKKSPYSKVMTLAANVPNTGSLNWTVPGTGGGIVCGDEYAIAVTRLATPTTNALGPWFTLECGGAPPPIMVTQPPNGDLLVPGSGLTLKWTGGDPGTPVNIFLMKQVPLSLVTVVAMNAPNNGLRTWALPNQGGAIPIYCGHKYGFAATHAQTPPANLVGPWFTIVCGGYNIRVQKVITAAGFLIYVWNGPLTMASLPVGARLQVTEEIPLGRTVTFSGGPWTCAPTSATGPAAITCTHTVANPIPVNGNLLALSFNKSGFAQGQSCTVVKLLVKDNSGQYVTASEATLDDNKQCVP